jgi:hypothetical protein
MTIDFDKITFKINLITIYRLFKKYILKKKDMCLRKLFGKNDPTKPFEYKPKTALLFAINNYPGSQNDLNGCIPDQDDLIEILKEFNQEFAIRNFKDSQVTVNCFKSELAKAIEALPGVPVVFISDSCYSGSNTRDAPKFKSRFMPNTRITYVTKVRNKLFLNENKIGNWLSISGCKEDQTSADAVFDGKYNGACTYALIHVLRVAKIRKNELTYSQWVGRGNELLKTNGFTQVMTIEGPDELKNRIVFNDPCILVHYSGHGTYTNDKDGDETDGYDEALYLYDGLLLDDDMNKILSKIKY